MYNIIGREALSSSGLSDMLSSSVITNGPKSMSRSVTQFSIYPFNRLLFSQPCLIDKHSIKLVILMVVWCDSVASELIFIKRLVEFWVLQADDDDNYYCGKTKIVKLPKRSRNTQMNISTNNWCARCSTGVSVVQHVLTYCLVKHFHYPLYTTH